MSMMRCDRHGAWDSDNYETCPRCEEYISYLEARVEELKPAAPSGGHVHTIECHAKGCSISCPLPTPQDRRNAERRVNAALTYFKDRMLHDRRAAQPAPDLVAFAGNPPFAECEFQYCDLPGQCVSEGKCHHPKAQPAPTTETPRPEMCGHGNFWGHCCLWVAGGDGVPRYIELERDLTAARAEIAEKETDRHYHMNAINRLAKFLAFWGTSDDVIDAAMDNIKRFARELAELRATLEGMVMVPKEPTMGIWDDFCAVFEVPFDKFIPAWKAALAVATEGTK